MDKIQILINKISKIYDNFNYNIIERDILLDNIRELYSEILLLDNNNLKNEAIEKQKIAEEQRRKELEAIEKQRIAEEQRRKELEAIEKQRIAEEQRRKELEAIEKQRIAEEQRRKELEAIEKQRIAEEQEIAKSQNNETKKTEIIGETLHQGETLYDKLAKQKQKDIADKIQETAITNILSAIPIGERFLYIKELFNNNANLFNEAILNIEQQKSFEDAINFLMYNYKIDENNEHLLAFFKIIRRKFL